MSGYTYGDILPRSEAPCVYILENERVNMPFGNWNCYLNLSVSDVRENTTTIRRYTRISQHSTQRSLAPWRMDVLQRLFGFIV